VSEATIARARAVADLPVEPLAARAPQLSQEWALALVRARRPERIGEVRLAEIALDGPPLCVAVLRALGSEVELARLTGADAAAGSAPALRLTALAGGDDAVGVVDATEALRGVLWQALERELGAAPARYAGDACDRLAYVCAAALAAALGAGGPSAGARAPQHEPRGERAAPGSDAPAHVVEQAVIVDERESPPRVSGEGGAAPPEASSPVIEIRDQRGGEGPGAWIGAIGRQLERHRIDGVPFAVLLAELTELDGLREREGTAAADGVAGAVERLLASELRGSDRHPAPGAREAATITCERPGRYWLLAPGADRAGAQYLAERLTRAATAILTARGGRAHLVVGTASCPHDGREAAALAAHADVGLYAARAAARAAVQHSPAGERPA
jgi:GGDEF domain-containing protein